MQAKPNKKFRQIHVYGGDVRPGDVLKSRNNFGLVITIDKSSMHTEPYFVAHVQLDDKHGLQCIVLRRTRTYIKVVTENDDGTVLN